MSNGSRDQSSPDDNIVPFPRSEGKKHAHHRYEWYEQIAANGLEYLIGTAHFIAKEDFRIGYDRLVP
jgi:hypothetical protein